MDSGKPHLQVVTALPTFDPRGELADRLEDLAGRVRRGEVEADHGVLVLQNVAGGKVYPPLRLGMARSPTETIGLLGYAQTRIYRDEIDDA